MQRSCVTAIPPSLLCLRPTYRQTWQQGAPRVNLFPRATYLPKANLSTSHSPHFRHSKHHEKWTVYQHIQNWWNGFNASYNLKPVRATEHEKKEIIKNLSLELDTAVSGDGSQQSLEYRTLWGLPEAQKKVRVKKAKAETKTKTQITVKTKTKSKKRKRKARKGVLKPTSDRRPKASFQQLDTEDFFSIRLHEVLCSFYAGVLNGTLPASVSVKEFLATTHFDEAFQTLSQAVLPKTKEMIRNVGKVGITASFPRLRQDCWVNKQGCYANKITTPNKDFGLYIGGAASLRPGARQIIRPLRGDISAAPYAVSKPGPSAGVGRRVNQHLYDPIRLKNKASAHYKFMEAAGNRYDFRLLAAFEKEVEFGAVWLLEAFFVLELGTIKGQKLERDGTIFTGLNQVSPLVTNCQLPMRSQQARRSSPNRTTASYFQEYLGHS